MAADVNVMEYLGARVRIDHYNACRLFNRRTRVSTNEILDNTAKDLVELAILRRTKDKTGECYALLLDANPGALMRAFSRHVKVQGSLILHHSRDSDSAGTIRSTIAPDADEYDGKWVRVLNVKTGEYEWVAVKQLELF